MLPPARMKPHGVTEHAEAIALRTRHRARRITTNRVTRSGWFVGGIGALLLSPLAITALYLAWWVVCTPHGK
jgi:hypothetical protein